MSKYEKLWRYIQQDGKLDITLSFVEIKKILGFDIDHSFLTYKKELLNFGYCIVKISLKEKKILFRKTKK